MFTVFSHLIQNALAFCPDGSEKIEIQADEIHTQEAGNSKEAVLITIADNGTGVSEGQEDLIFEPFYTSRADGTGLGLAIVKQTIEEHHGQISVTNRAPTGAVFCIRLPVPSQE